MENIFQVVSKASIESVTKKRSYQNPPEPEKTGQKYWDNLDYLKWTMKLRNNIEAFKKAVEDSREFTSGFYPTKEFLKILSSAKYSRINYLLDRARYNTIEVTKPVKELKNIKSKTNLLVYDYSKSGEVSLKAEIHKSYGRLTKVRWNKTFDLLVSQEQYNEGQERLRLFSQRLLEAQERQQDSDILTDRQKKAVSKLTTRIQRENTIQVKCPSCSAIGYFGLTPNLETDKYEGIASDIIHCAIKDYQEIGCPKCRDKARNEDNVWKVEELENMLANMEKGKTYQIPIETFCQEFRADKRVISQGYAKEKLMEISSSPVMLRKGILYLDW